MTPMCTSSPLLLADPASPAPRRSLLRRAALGVALAVAIVAAALAPGITGADSAAAATDGRMIVPASGNIQSKVGDGCHGNVRQHQGIDITGPGYAPILAAYDGVVKTRGTNAGYGNFVDIEHPGGYMTRYGHMAEPGMFAPGTTVERGQQIGIVGKTGNTTAFHLHFEVWRNGAVWADINQGFTCLTNVVRGSVIPMGFPGLGTAAPVKGPGADYDGDGRNDLLVVAADSDLKIYPGDGTGRFRAPEIITSAWGIHHHVTHADFNADGKADLLVARSNGELELYSGSGGRGFDAHAVIGTGWYDMLHVTSGADYSGDGRHDLLAVTKSGTLNLHRGDGTGRLSGQPQAVGNGWQTFACVIGGDFNGDGKGDIMGVDGTGTLYFYPGLTTGFGSRRTVGTGWKAFVGVTGGVDYNGDGRADLLAHAATGELFLYPGDGRGSVAQRISVGTLPTGHVQFE